MSDPDGMMIDTTQHLRPTLLVVEDHPAMRAAIVTFLQGEFEVTAITNGQAALETAARLMPDVMILDVALPMVDGTEVARRLKAQGSKAKIVFLSVSMDARQITACRAAGGDAYVWKARMGTDLIPAIKDAMAGKAFVHRED